MDANKMKVTLYGAEWCAFCQTEKQWLDSKNIKYEYVDIEESESAKEAITQLSGTSSVPLTHVIDDDKNVFTILGFDRQRLSHAIGIK